jgi:4-hydroxy-L-threonine phosphate dehydrogenase PdxA
VNISVKSKLVVTIGNPNGIGPEVCNKAFQQIPKEILKNCIVVGDQKTVHHYFSPNIYKDCEFVWVNPEDSGVNFKFEPGNPTPESASCRFSISTGCTKLMKKTITLGIVTVLLYPRSYRRFRT